MPTLTRTPAAPPPGFTPVGDAPRPSRAAPPGFTPVEPRSPVPPTSFTPVDPLEVELRDYVEPPTETEAGTPIIPFGAARTAAEIREDTWRQQQMTAYQEGEPVGVREAITKGLQPAKILDTLPVVGSLLRATGISLDAPRERPEPTGNAEFDQAAEQNWLAEQRNTQVEAERPRTFGANVANAVQATIPFAGEIAMGGPGAVGPGAAGIKAAFKRASSSVGRALPFFSPRVVATAAENMQPQYDYQAAEDGLLREAVVDFGDDLLPAMGKSLASTAIEIVSEQSGEVLGVFGAAALKLPVVRVAASKLGEFKAALVGKLMDATGLQLPEFVNRLKQFGYHGVIAEMGEERVADAMYGALDVVAPGYGQPFALPSGEQLATEAVAFAIPGMANVAMIAAGARMVGKPGSVENPIVLPTPQVQPPPSVAPPAMGEPVPDWSKVQLVEQPSGNPGELAQPSPAPAPLTQDSRVSPPSLPQPSPAAPMAEAVAPAPLPAAPPQAPPAALPLEAPATTENVTPEPLAPQGQEMPVQGTQTEEATPPGFVPVEQQEPFNLPRGRAGRVQTVPPVIGADEARAAGEQLQGDPFAAAGFKPAKEPAKPAVNEQATLEPWQMTKDEIYREWSRAQDQRTSAQAAHSGMTMARNAAVPGRTIDEKRQNLNIELGRLKEEIAKAQERVNRYDAYKHEKRVKEALAQGLPVPERVLAEYPHLREGWSTTTLKQKLEQVVEPNGNASRGMDAIRGWIREAPPEQLSEAHKWATEHESSYVRRFFAGELGASLSQQPTGGKESANEQPTPPGFTPVETASAQPVEQPAEGAAVDSGAGGEGGTDELRSLAAAEAFPEIADLLAEKRWSDEQLGQARTIIDSYESGSRQLPQEQWTEAQRTSGKYGIPVEKYSVDWRDQDIKRLRERAIEVEIGKREKADEAYHKRAKAVTSAALPGVTVYVDPEVTKSHKGKLDLGKEQMTAEQILEKMKRLGAIKAPTPRLVTSPTYPKKLPGAPKSVEDEIGTLRPFTAKEATRYAIPYVYVGSNEAVATDGRRLAIVTASIPGGFAKYHKPDPGIDVEDLKKKLAGVEKRMERYKGERKGQSWDAIIKDYDGLRYQLGLAEGRLYAVQGTAAKVTMTDPGDVGQFPHWRDIVPKYSQKDAIKIDILETLRNVRKASILTSEDSKGVVVVLNPDGTLGFAARAPGVGHVEINTLEGNRVLGGANPAFFEEALEFVAKAGSPTASFSFPQPNKPMVFESGRHKHILMPVNTEGVGETVPAYDAPPAPKPAKPAVDEQATPEPWQMTRDEYDAARVGRTGLRFDIEDLTGTGGGRGQYGAFLEHGAGGMERIVRHTSAPSGSTTHELEHVAIYRAMGDAPWDSLPKDAPERAREAFEIVTGLSYRNDDGQLRTHLRRDIPDWKRKLADDIATGTSSLRHYGTRSEVLRSLLHAWGRGPTEARKVIEAELPDLAAIFERMDVADLTPHRVAVERAIAEGKAVPANVLAEYPDIVNPKSSGGSTSSSEASRPVKDMPEFEPKEGTAVGAARERVSPVAIPELVKLAKAILGDVPSVKKMSNAWGRFYPAKGAIKINPELGKDPVAMASTLAHEIGHAVDWAPTREMRRGNLLGRLFTLTKHLKNTFGTSSVTNKEVRDEIVAVSRWWRGWDPALLSKSKRAYYNSAKELYADALSVLLNSPGELETRAPKFYRTFFEALDRKPNVLNAYLGLQDLINGVPADLQRARRADLREGFARGETVWRARQEEARASGMSIIGKVKQLFIDKASPIIDAENAAAKAGATIRDSESATYAMDELTHKDSVNHVFLEDVERTVWQPMREAGLTMDDVGEFMAYRRMINERTEIINPLGHTPDTAQQAMDNLEQTLGAEKFAALHKHVQRFDDMVFKVAEQAVDVGVYNAETFEKTIVPNKGNYAAFAVVDYLEANMPAGIRQQVGTFRDIANPFVATTMKTVSLNRAIELNRAKNKVRDMLKRYHAGEITKKPHAPGGQPRKAQPGYDHMVVMENGNATFYEVDKYIARAFERNDIGILAEISRAISAVTYKPFHALYVTASPGFAVANLFRDIKRTYKNLAAVKEHHDKPPTLREVLKAYWDAAPTAWRRARKQHDPLIREMMEQRVLDIPFTSYDFADTDDNHERMMKRYGLGQDVPGRNRITQLFADIFHGIEAISVFTESVPKVATFKMLRDRGVSPEYRNYVVRNYVGTPNYKTKGLATELTNGLFMYSKVVMQGWRADARIATRPQTAAGYWMRGTMIDFAPKLAQHAAKIGLFGAAVAAIMKMIPDSDLKKYICIPLGATREEKSGEMKAVYLRIPHDDANRPLAAMLWDALQGEYSGMAEEAYGELPGISPPIEMAHNWIQFASGRNPYDAFRGRDIISRDAWEAGGWYAGEEMVRWTLDQFGVASTIMHAFIGKPGDPARETTAEKIIGSIPGLSRILKISNRGMYEDAWSEVREEEAEGARRRLKLDDLTRTMLRDRYKLTRLGEERLDDRDKIRRVLLNEHYKVYLDVTLGIKYAEERGDTDEAKRLRGVLKDASKQFDEAINNATKERK